MLTVRFKVTFVVGYIIVIVDSSLLLIYPYFPPDSKSRARKYIEDSRLDEFGKCRSVLHARLVASFRPPCRGQVAVVQPFTRLTTGTEQMINKSNNLNRYALTNTEDKSLHEHVFAQSSIITVSNINIEFLQRNRLFRYPSWPGTAHCCITSGDIADKLSAQIDL